MFDTESSTMGERNWNPRYYDGLDDDGQYLGPHLQLPHYPDRYHHGHPASANRFPPIQHNPPLSQMDDGPSSTTEFPDFDKHLFPSLPHHLKDMPEVGSSSFIEGPSPPSPSKHSHDFNGLSLPMEARSSLALPSFENDQHESSWGLPRLLHLDQSTPLYPQESPNIPEIDGIITDPTLESSLPSHFDVFRLFPIPVTYAYQEAEGAQNSGSRPALIDELMTPNQVLSGFAELPTNGHDPPLPYSTLQNEGAASPNDQSAVQTSHPIITPPSTPSNQGAAVNENRSKFWCRRRGCGASFVQRQGLNRHKRDKHRPRNICPFCTSFEWRSGRKYLFREHLEQHHPGQDPEAALALAQFLATGALNDK